MAAKARKGSLAKGDRTAGDGAPHHAGGPECVGRGCGKRRGMTPMVLLAKLAAFIPRLRDPLVCDAGLLGSRRAWRKEVLPRPRELQGACEGAARGSGRVASIRTASPGPGAAAAAVMRPSAADLRRVRVPRPARRVAIAIVDCRSISDAGRAADGREARDQADEGEQAHRSAGSHAGSASSLSWIPHEAARADAEPVQDPPFAPPPLNNSAHLPPVARKDQKSTRPPHAEWPTRPSSL